ncbi:MAG: hypothetical protein WC748_00645 [Legionellales bacterium]
MLSVSLQHIIKKAEKFASQILEKTNNIAAFKTQSDAFKDKRKLFAETESMSDEERINATLYPTLIFIKQFKEKNINSFSVQNVSLDFESFENMLRDFSKKNSQKISNVDMYDDTLIAPKLNDYFDLEIDVLLKFETFANWVYSNSENIQDVATLRTTYRKARENFELSLPERFDACDTFIKGFTSKLIEKNQLLSRDFSSKRLALSAEFKKIDSAASTPLGQAIVGRAYIDDMARKKSLSAAIQLFAGMFCGLALISLMTELNSTESTDTSSSSSNDEDTSVGDLLLFFYFIFAYSASAFLPTTVRNLQSDDNAFHGFVKNRTGYDMVSDRNDFISSKYFFMAFSWFAASSVLLYDDIFDSKDYKSWLLTSSCLLSTATGNAAGRIFDETRALCCNIFPRSGERASLLNNNNNNININININDIEQNNQMNDIDKDPIFQVTGVKNIMMQKMRKKINQ